MAGRRFPRKSSESSENHSLPRSEGLNRSIAKPLAVDWASDGAAVRIEEAAISADVAREIERTGSGTSKKGQQYLVSEDRAAGKTKPGRIALATVLRLRLP